jgi:hypothetical protein
VDGHSAALATQPVTSPARRRLGSNVPADRAIRPGLPARPALEHIKINAGTPGYTAADKNRGQGRTRCRGRSASDRRTGLPIRASRCNAATLSEVGM